MSSIQKINFTPVSDVLHIHRRDYPVADRSLVNPLNALALLDGEWMTLNSSSQLIRASTIGSLGNAATVLSFPLFVERGRSDVQSLAEKKMSILWMGVYEFDTRVFDASVTVGSGAPITTMLQPLKVATVAIGSRNYTGLVGHGGAADTHPIAGYVTRLPSANGGQLRFRSRNA